MARRELRTKGTGSKQGVVRDGNRWRNARTGEKPERWRCRWRENETLVQRTARSENQADLWLSRVQDLRFPHDPTQPELGIEAAVRSALKEAAPVEGGPLRFGVLVDHYIDNDVAQRKHVHAGILRRQRSIARHIKGSAIDKLSTRIDAATVKRWLEPLRVGRTDKTINRIVALASKAWQHGQEHGHIPGADNPFVAARARRPERAPKKTGKLAPFTKAEAEAILEHIEDVDFRDFALAMLCCGWRPRELRHLAWEDVDLPGARMTCQPRYDKRRLGKTVKLSPRLLERLKDRRKRLSGPLVFTHGNARRWTAPTLLRRFNAARDAAIEDGSVSAMKAGQPLYGLKHAFVTIMAGQGVPLGTISKIAGVRIATLEAAYFGEDESAQAQALEQVWGDEGSRLSRARRQVE